MDREKIANASSKNLRVHFKNTRETASALKGMNILRAKNYLQNVVKKEEIVPFNRYKYGVSRKAQVKNQGGVNGRWPVKSALYLLKVLKNAISNAKTKNLQSEHLFISHIIVNRAMKGQRRTFRAHGRINRYLSNPCHVEMWLKEKTSHVPRSYT
mmetsp:Transcript_40966/g.63945  ORF Transcript_40966/g.63945 Transcript_40966/m.63945 type:complete len:155 (+) Transcript_40966:1988-2452(+)